MFERYDPVLIEHKSLNVLHYNVTYRRGVNNDTDFYIEKGERIPIIFLHGPGVFINEIICTIILTTLSVILFF